ncbi:hypothetical protein GF339_14905 [candidate division KSB3 bacterium]|uniref:Uncharacterized protein n=1 Tax=candidate division KSB3 bacterium TaxID=2044937 RepID=A0A9D5Q6Y9_9BACT|nr:hypothetical protein [candidate division KSB3 bacterium]MBD3325873.1 hypothetical protein [candidate division KSB3 bacterium]
MKYLLQKFINRSLREKRLVLVGLLSLLLLLRGAEYALDLLLGNGDGYITTGIIAFSLTLLYAIGFLLSLLAFVLTFRLDQKHPGWHIGLVSLLCLGVWLIFYPGGMSPDSIDQYRQAVTRTFHDWHPPIMSLLLAGLMEVGGDIEVLMLLQCLLGGFGVYMLARSIAEMSGIAPRPASCLGLITFSILLYPLSPLAHYLMTFWKDTWCAIEFLWILAIAVRLYSKAQRLSPLAFYSRYSLFIVLSTVLLLTRHNAVAVLPFLVLMSWFILSYQRKLPVFRAMIISLSLILLYIGATIGQYALFQVERRHPVQQVMALDLVGMIVQNPALREELPYTSRHLTPEYMDAYQYGDIVSLYEDAIDDLFHYSREMIEEYRRAIQTFPLTWLVVKWRAFYELLRPSRIYKWFHMGISDNPFGLRHNELFQPVREALRIRMLIVWHNPILRLLSGVHLVWIGITLGGIGGSMRVYWRSRSPDALFCAILLSLPLTYYGSYFFATTAWDFRFMYPATLSVQVITLAYVWKWLKKIPIAA